MPAIPRSLSLSLLGIIFLILGGFAVGAQEQVTVTLTPIILAAEESGIVEGQIECADLGCSAFAVVITFDPEALQVDTAEIGPFLGEDFFPVENEIDNTEGWVRLAAVILGDPPEEIESKVLFRLYVTAITPGLAELAISELEIGDAVGNSLPALGVDSRAALEAGATVEATPEIVEATEEPEPIPCTVMATELGMPIRVGPGNNRSVRRSMPVDTAIRVLGQYVDEAGERWWKLQAEDIEEIVAGEVDRYWVAEADVTANGDCEKVAAADPSAYVAAPVAQPTPTTTQSAEQPAGTPGEGGGGTGPSCDTTRSTCWVSDGWLCYKYELLCDCHGNCTVGGYLGFFDGSLCGYASTCPGS